MFVHVWHHIMDVELEFLRYLPGVPAFFFVSGFLIYASYLKSNNLKDYFKNRLLRLMPALILITIFSVALVLFVKGYRFGIDNYQNILIWFIAQVSLGQAYNPSIFRDIGVGVINGSLWTITVEIMFYFFVPIIVFMEKYVKCTVLFLFSLSFIIYTAGENLFGFNFILGKSLFEFLSLTPIVWGWMFLTGVLAYKYFEKIKQLSKYFIFVPCVMIVMVFINADNDLVRVSTNNLGLIYFVMYAATIMYLAFETQYIKLNFDISYGVYIWHMVMVNVFLSIDVRNPFLVVLLTLFIAFFSWYAIEKPSLKLKKYSIRN
jgi:peptidoglycan/LPS O-acetylase OafA/YrhL